jgi:uncharacterized protein YpiB (UPF0302 family)
MLINQKREFIEWFLKSVPVNSREVLWILNYIANHENVLKNLHIVEQANKTPRGIVIYSSEIEGNNVSIRLFKEDLEFLDVNQIFHEIRMHVEEELFLEFQFLNAWKTANYLMVLEDNPYSSWNEEVIGSLELESFLAQEEKKAALNTLRQKIDEALEKQNELDFIKYSKELSKLEE